MNKEVAVRKTASRSQESPNAAPPWVVLIVDDEPDVHEVTRMTLWPTEFAGAAVELHSAYSTAEARSFLDEGREIALVILDVVMETDDAGLQFCRYVREELRNTDVQIVLRTGQPGQAPEKEVMLNYDINGYFLKTEITAQKLHSILISSLRNYSYIKALKKYREGAAGSSPPTAARLLPGIRRKLQGAIEKDELDLLAQPQIDLKSGDVVGVEVLLRWSESQQAESTSQEIIDYAHRAGLEAPLAEWALRQACSMNKVWQDSGLDPFRIAVGVSSAQLLGDGFVQVVEQCLLEIGLPPACLELQVAESSLSKNFHVDKGALDAIRALQALGVSIAVDRFGLGSVSLSQLKRLHPDRLKIDRSFVRGVIDNPDNAAITRAIIALAHTLGMSVVAAGVETTEQLEFLKWEECEVAQGPYFAAPMPATHIRALLCDGVR